MGLTAYAAGWFLIAAAPIGFFVAYSDLSRMKIPNIAVSALVISYAVFGLFTLPFDVYVWGYAHLLIALIAGIFLNAAGAMGAGDAKFIAAAAPMIALDDLRLIIVLFAACLLSGYVSHRIAKYTPIRRAVPHWESWEAGHRFPMGYPLAMTLIFYLVIVIMIR
jgi:prepilin peptidase CpaA